MGIGILLVYFVYGLAFWVMGLAVLLESVRADSVTERRSLEWLAAFGMLHGTHEWFEMYVRAIGSQGIALPDWLVWSRLALLAVSFGCLSTYSLTALQLAPGKLTGRIWMLTSLSWAGLFIIVSAAAVLQTDPADWPLLLDAISRYLLAVPSAALASLAMWTASRSSASQARQEIAANLRLGALGFGGYALAQVVVQQMPWFPASAINQQVFLAFTGVPIQAVRAVMAALIALGLVRAQHGIERDRRAQLAAAHQARLAALEEKDSLRRDLLQHVVRSQEDERARIARELHDEVAQLLSAFGLHLGSLRLKLKRADTLAEVDQLQELTHQISESLYHLVRDLRPSHLDSLGLIPAIRYILNEEYGPRGLQVNLQTLGRPRPLPGSIEIAIFRVVQEALTNVARHSRVSSARIELLYEDRQVSLCISDEGAGFDPLGPLRPPRGWGLAGMRERVESLGGTFTLHSQPSRGTELNALIPLPPEPVKEAAT